MKKALSILLSCLFLIGTSSCAPKNANQLISQARREHGSCTVVSKSTADGETTVVLHDELQDFDYTVRSFRSKINIDGANAGSYPDSRDSFDEDLSKKVISNVKDDLDRIAEETGTIYYADSEKTGNLYPVILAKDTESGSKAAISFAEVIQTQNIDHRLDNVEITVYQDSEITRSSELGPAYRTRLGSVRLPEITFRDIEKETEANFIQIGLAHDKKAEYLGKEQKTFADTGLDLERVVIYDGESNPTRPDSPVTLYYFRASDGTDFWIGDFSYNYPGDEYFDRAASFRN